MHNSDCMNKKKQNLYFIKEIFHKEYFTDNCYQFACLGLLAECQHQTFVVLKFINFHLCLFTLCLTSKHENINFP